MISKFYPNIRQVLFAIPGYRVLLGYDLNILVEIWVELGMVSRLYSNTFLSVIDCRTSTDPPWVLVTHP